MMSHSKLYTYELPSHMKCWTTCELRISNYEDVAEQATSTVLREWKENGLPMIPSVGLKLTSGRYENNLMAASVPEALPNRLGPLTKMIDLLILADELSEDLNAAKAEKSMDCLSSATSDNLGKRGLKIIRSHVEQEIIETDPVLGRKYVQAMRNYWNFQKGFAKDRCKSPKDIQSYLPLRFCDFGGPTVLHILSFGTGLSLTEDDIEALRVPLFAATIACILWNDMYSWPKEADDYQNMRCANPTNAIGPLMEEHSVMSEEGLHMCRRMILQYEMKCRDAITELLAPGNSTLSPNGRRIAEACPPFVAGNALWSCTSDRFQALESSEYTVLQRVLSTEIPEVELDAAFEREFTNVFQASQRLERKYWEMFSE